MFFAFTAMGTKQVLNRLLSLLHAHQKKLKGTGHQYLSLLLLSTNSTSCLCRVLCVWCEYDKSTRAPIYRSALKKYLTAP
jgi:hypothetical protein